MALTYYMDFNFSKLECDKGELGMHSKDKIFLPYRLLEIETCLSHHKI